MKTPHSIKLIRYEESSQYDPHTGTYKPLEYSKEVIPCLANYLSQERVFELYGDRHMKVLIARFMQEVEPFQEAEYDGLLFKPVEQIDAPIKGAVRLKVV